MRWWAILLVLPAWGLYSAQLLAQAWFSWLGALIHLAGIIVGRGTRKQNGTQLASHVARLVVFAVLLAVGDIIIRGALDLGHSTLERVAYWAVAGVAFSVFMFRGRHQIKEMWSRAMAEARPSS